MVSGKVKVADYIHQLLLYVYMFGRKCGSPLITLSGSYATMVGGFELVQNIVGYAEDSEEVIT